MDTFRILMVLPSVFTRGWDHFGRKIPPRGGGPKTPFLGVPGAPPPPPGGGGRGGTPPEGGAAPPPGGYPPTPPWGGYPPLPGGGETPAKKDPPPGDPKFMHKFMTQIREGNYERGSAL